MALNPGHLLLNGHYRILGLLGRGGFGSVYEAEDTLLQEKVAIKELIPALVGDEALLRRFLAEARATMRLRHKRIVGTYNVFSEGDNYYIAMEHMPGGSLEQRLRERGSLPLAEAVQMAAEVCEGLAFAHEERVVHCDLKPANILFDAAGQARVADFGIAHISGEMLTRSWATPAGFVAGTLPYMSPEQTDGVRDDPRLDLYALGAVLYRALTGRTYLDFDQQETPRAQAANVGRIDNEQPLPPSRHNPGVPAWLDGVVLKALAKRPEERYANAAQMRAALLQPEATRPAPREASQPAPREASQPAPREMVRPALTPLSSERRAAPVPAVPREPVPSLPTATSPAHQAAPPGPQPRPTSQSAADRRRRRLTWALAGAAALLLVALVAGWVAILGGGKQGPAKAIPSPSTALAPAAAATLLPTEPPTPAPAAHKPGQGIRVGMVTDVSGVDGSGPNQRAWEGLLAAQEELGVEAVLLESRTEADHAPNIAALAEQKYDLVVTVGFALADATAAVAAQHPGTRFAAIDVTYDPPLPNVQGSLFRVDEAAFPAGYLAAGWAALKDPAGPQVGWIGGVPIPAVEMFVVAYQNGVHYYNEQKGAAVRVEGAYAGDFGSPDKGRAEGNALIDAGVDVILVAAGETGNGGLAAARERGKWGIGVDVDQYLALPGEREILLTSCLKRLDQATLAIVRSVVEGRFAGGTNYVGPAANGAVGLAPYHDFESQIPAELKAEVAAIQEGIAAGRIETGWGP